MDRAAHRVCQVGQFAADARGVVDDLDAEGWRTLERAVESSEVDIELALPGEGGETEVFFSDLTHEYVTINSEYST
mgnify:CR=1 FL=1